MNKRSLLIVLLLPVIAMAQRSVDLDKYRFSVQYRSLPALKIDSTYRTYNVEIESTKLSQHLMQELTPASMILLEGWKKLPQDGHVNINVKLGDLIPGAVSVQQRSETVRGRNGQSTTRTFYYQEVVYTFDALAKITDYKGAHIMDQVLADPGYKQVYRSPEFANRIMAESYFVVNSVAVTKELYRKSVNNAMRYLNERINYNMGFQEVTANDFMWIIDSRKHPEYSAHRKAFIQMNEVLFNMNANTPITHAREELKPVIDYFEKIKRNYPSTSKHDRKIRYASYYNLAVIYYYLDEPQAMIKEANGLELNDFDGNDAKGFVKTATWLKTLFQQNNIYTRHFPVDTAQFKGPYEKPSLSSN